MKKTLDEIFEQLLIMTKIYEDADYAKSFDGNEFRDFILHSYNAKDKRALLILHQEMLSRWYECLDNKVRLFLFFQYKQIIGKDIKDDFKSNTERLNNIIKRKIILDEEEFEFIQDILSDNFELAHKKINLINDLINDYSKRIF